MAQIIWAQLPLRNSVFASSSRRRALEKGAALEKVNIHMKNGLRINQMALKDPATDRGFRIEEFKTSILTTWSHFRDRGRGASSSGTAAMRAARSHVVGTPGRETFSHIPSRGIGVYFLKFSRSKADSAKNICALEYSRP